MSQQITWNFRVIQENPFLLFQFSTNFSFGAKFDNKVQQTLYRNFNHKIYNSKRFQNAILHQNLSIGTEDIFNFTSKNVWNWMKKWFRFHTFFSLQLKISRVPVARFWYKIAFWKRYELQIIWFKFRQSLLNFIVKFGLKVKFAEN